MATIKDVAQLAKVSPAVVSRLMNEDPTLSIREETEKRVYAAIEQLGYRPNLMARGLRIKETRIIAMVIADITNPFFPAMVKGAQKAAGEDGFILTLFDAEEDMQNERKFIEAVFDRQMDGVILTSLFVEDDTAQIVDNLNLPHVLIQRSARNASGLYVGVNDVLGASLAVKHLIDIGHTRIATISGSLRTETGVRRLEGYRKTLAENEIEFDEQYVANTDFTEKGGYQAMMQLLALPHPPSAVFAANDLMALGAMAAIKGSGLRIPEDISVVGYDDIWVSGKTTPALTTVRVDQHGIGYTACKTLISRIRGEAAAREQILDVELIIRDSTRQN